MPTPYKLLDPTYTDGASFIEGHLHNRWTNSKAQGRIHPQQCYAFMGSLLSGGAPSPIAALKSSQQALAQLLRDLGNKPLGPQADLGRQNKAQFHTSV